METFLQGVDGDRHHCHAFFCRPFLDGCLGDESGSKVLNHMGTRNSSKILEVHSLGEERREGDREGREGGEGEGGRGEGGRRGRGEGRGT